MAGARAVATCKGIRKVFMIIKKNPRQSVPNSECPEKVLGKSRKSPEKVLKIPEKVLKFVL